LNHFLTKVHKVGSINLRADSAWRGGANPTEITGLDKDGRHPTTPAKTS